MEVLKNRPDEWKIEQGLAGAKLPFINQTGAETIFIEPAKWPVLTKDEAAIKAIGDRDQLFTRERQGWKGSVTRAHRPAPRSRHMER